MSGLESGNFVRIAGVEVGKVKKISIQDDGTAVVEFSPDNSVVLTEGSKAVIRYQNLIGGRYLALEEGPGSTRQLKPGDTIPLDPNLAGVGFGRADRRLPAVVPRAGSQPDQRLVQ